MPAARRQNDQPRHRLVGHIRARLRRGVDARECALLTECRAALQPLLQLRPRIVEIDPRQPIRRNPVEIGFRIEPVAAFRPVQKRQSARQRAQRVAVQRRTLAGLNCAQQNSRVLDSLLLRGRRAAQKHRPRQPPARLKLSVARRLAVDLRRLRAGPVDIAVQRAVPHLVEIADHLLLDRAVGQRQRAGHDQRPRIVRLPEPIDAVRHQLQHAARPLEAIHIARPVEVQPVENLRVNRVALFEPRQIRALARLAGEIGRLAVHRGEGAAGPLPLLGVDRIAEQPPPHHLERLVVIERLPGRADPLKDVTDLIGDLRAARIAELDLRLGDRDQHRDFRVAFRRFG